MLGRPSWADRAPPWATCWSLLKTESAKCQTQNCEEGGTQRASQLLRRPLPPPPAAPGGAPTSAPGGGGAGCHHGYRIGLDSPWAQSLLLLLCRCEFGCEQLVSPCCLSLQLSLLPAARAKYPPLADIDQHLEQCMLPDTTHNSGVLHSRLTSRTQSPHLPACSCQAPIASLGCNVADVLCEKA